MPCIVHKHQIRDFKLIARYTHRCHSNSGVSGVNSDLSSGSGFACRRPWTVPVSPLYGTEPMRIRLFLRPDVPVPVPVSLQFDDAPFRLALQNRNASVTEK